MRKRSNFSYSSVARRCALVFAAAAALPAASAFANACGTDNGRALSAKPVHLCRAGTASAVSGNGTWHWSCDDGTTLTQCSANKALSYSFKTIDYPGAALTIIYGLNDRGDATGYYVSGTLPHAMVFHDHNGQYETLDANGTLGTSWSFAGNVNDWGIVTGAYEDAAKNQHGYLLEGNYLSTVDFPGAANSQGADMNLLGTLVGEYWNADLVMHGFVRRFGVFTPFDLPGAVDTFPYGINTVGDIVGEWDNAIETHGFHMSAHGQLTTIDVPSAPANSTTTVSINDLGQIVGFYADEAGFTHGYMLTGGHFRFLDVPDAPFTYAYAVNNFEQISGAYLDSNGKWHGFLATPHL